MQVKGSPNVDGGLHLHAVEPEGAVAGDEEPCRGLSNLAAMAKDAPTPRQPEDRDRAIVRDATAARSWPRSRRRRLVAHHDRIGRDDAGDLRRPAVVGDRHLRRRALGVEPLRSSFSCGQPAGATPPSGRQRGRQDLDDLLERAPDVGGEPDLQRTIPPELGRVAIDHAHGRIVRERPGGRRTQTEIERGAEREDEIGLVEPTPGLRERQRMIEPRHPRPAPFMKTGTPADSAKAARALAASSHHTPLPAMTTGR